jgi:metalloendopeptidase OMA1, mitochondrial
LFSVMSAPVITSCVSIPGTDRKAFILMSRDTEIGMGDAAYKEVLSKSKVVTSGPQYEMVQRVGRRIAAVADVKDFNWKFALVDDPTMNAFCLPGGKVVFYTGILPVLQNEAGMAVVMGHEVAHAVARHGAERVSRSMAVNAGVVAVSAGAFHKDPEKFSASMALLGAGATVGLILPFSRNNELEADTIGLRYAARAGYDPSEGPRFWSRFATAGKGGKPPQWLSTHPADTTRIKNLEKLQREVEADYQKSPKYGLGEKIK